MSAESAPNKQFTASEQQFQRLLLREQRSQSQPGDSWKRLSLNTSILLGATAVDLAESHLVDKFIRNPMKENVTVAKAASKEAETKFDVDAFKAAHKEIGDEQMEGAITKAKEALWKPAQNMQGKKYALEFVEEWASDNAYASLANAWVRLMTGKENAHYVTETSAVLADLFIIWSQVFNDNAVYPKRFRKAGSVEEPQRGWRGIKKAYEAADFVSSVNVEAALRILEEVPVVGDGFAWLHHKSDQLIESTIGRWANTAFAKGILGFHIGRNVKPL